MLLLFLLWLLVRIGLNSLDRLFVSRRFFYLSSLQNIDPVHSEIRLQRVKAGQGSTPCLKAFIWILLNHFAFLRTRYHRDALADVKLGIVLIDHGQIAAKLLGCRLTA